MAIALVTGQVAVAEATSAAVTVTLPNNPTPGNLVVVLFSFNNNTTTISSIKDTAGTPNNYTQTTKSPYINTSTFGGNDNTIGIAYLANVPVGATKSITITLSVSQIIDLWAAEFSGAAISPFENDATNHSSTASTTINLPTYTTLNNGDLLVAVNFVSGAVSSANSPWTEISTLPASGSGAEYTIQTSAGAQAVGWTASSSTWAAIEAAFKAATTNIDGYDHIPHFIKPLSKTTRLSAALMGGDQGIENVYVFVPPPVVPPPPDVLGFTD